MMMKIKKKGKVHPSPSSSTSSSKEREVVVLSESVLSLVPAAILSLASVLSLEDQQVLAYMLTRSLKTTTSTSTHSTTNSSSNNKKKPLRKSQTNNNNHVPMFDCECFDCYTSFWVRWDTSPNRDLIHTVIEAFEDHLASDERPNNARPNKKRSRSDKLGRRQAHNPTADPSPTQEKGPLPHAQTTLLGSLNAVVSGTPVVVNEEEGSDRQNDAVEETDDVAVVNIQTAEHRGLARKVLPDVLGLFNSRFWSLWSPNA